MALNVHLGTVVGSAIETNMDGENDVRMLSAELSSAEDVQSIELIGQNGEQTNPLDDATVVILEITKAWKIAIALKDLVEPDATLERGEKKIYAVDSSNNVIAWMYFKGDGSILIENDNGSLELTDTGEIVNNEGTDWAIQFTEMKSAFDTLVSDVNSMISAWNTFAGAYVPGGPAVQGTPPSASTTSSSSADMSNAKITTVRMP